MFEQLTEEKVREILGDAIKKDNSLRDTYDYLDWSGNNEDIVLDSNFSLDKLEAIVWWVRNKKVAKDV